MNFTGRPSFRKSPMFNGKSQTKAWLQLILVLIAIVGTWVLSQSSQWGGDVFSNAPGDSQQENQPDSSELPTITPTITPPPSQDSGATQSSAEDVAERPLGELRDLGDDVFESTAGLIYKSGSADGHRIDHVLEHGSDEPGKQVHGVFDPGDRSAVLAVIDEAWLKARKGGSDVRKQKQNQRTVYTIRMNRKVGYVGGKDGKQQKYPECKNIRIVVEGSAEVITAYPVKQF